VTRPRPLAGVYIRNVCRACLDAPKAAGAGMAVTAQPPPGPIEKRESREPEGVRSVAGFSGFGIVQRWSMQALNSLYVLHY
jgi:hypothetical protein